VDKDQVTCQPFFASRPPDAAAKNLLSACNWWTAVQQTLPLFPPSLRVLLLRPSPHLRKPQTEEDAREKCKDNQNRGAQGGRPPMKAVTAAARPNATVRGL